MDWIEIIKAIILGTVEGITEWLPISSTGHMILVDEFLQLNMTEAFKEMFFVVIQLGAKMISGISPTFINHMINESEDYIRIMNALLKNEMPVTTPLQLHNLWLPDASGHAEIIDSGLDGVEKVLKERSAGYIDQFNALSYKTKQFIGYTRTGLHDFPALDRLNEDANATTLSFMDFLQRVALLKISRRALGTLLPLMADHMFREECYYLTQLSQVAPLKNPGCNPAKPRI